LAKLIGISPSESEKLEFFEANHYMTLYNKEVEDNANKGSNNVDIASLFK
jgi:hypothetical protein